MIFLPQKSELPFAPAVRNPLSCSLPYPSSVEAPPPRTQAPTTPFENPNPSSSDNPPTANPFLPQTGGFFLIGGVIFFFDRAMLAMGNVRLPRPPTPPQPQPNPTLSQILFLIGLTIIIGPSKTAVFFARKQKLKGTAAFFGGLALIVLRWPLIGFLVELYGILVLFGDFLGTIAGFARNVPVVGTYIGVVVDKLGMVAMRNAELPV